MRRVLHFQLQLSGPNFLGTPRVLEIASIAEMCGGRLVDEDRGGDTVTGLSSLGEPREGALVFVQPRTKPEMLSRLGHVGAVLCADDQVDRIPEGPVRIAVSSPLAAFAVVGRALYPQALGSASASASQGYAERFPDARVSALAQIEDDVDIGPGAVVGDHAAVGRGSVIGANVVICDHCQIGRNCMIGPGAVIQFALIGNNVVLHAGVKIGQEGFGFVPGAKSPEKVPQLGRAILQDLVEIGANSTIDRGTLDDTVVGEGTKIDNLVQIAHNVRIGRNCLIAAHSGISGSVAMGDGCMLGGRVGIADHVTIGSGVQIAASSGVMNDIPDGERWAGLPALPFKEFFREMAVLRKMARADKTPKANRKDAGSENE